MILALGIIGLLWLPAIVLILALCQAAARGDRQTEDAPRRRGAHRGTWS